MAAESSSGCNRELRSAVTRLIDSSARRLALEVLRPRERRPCRVHPSKSVAERKWARVDGNRVLQAESKQTTSGDRARRDGPVDSEEGRSEGENALSEGWFPHTTSRVLLLSSPRVTGRSSVGCRSRGTRRREESSTWHRCPARNNSSSRRTRPPLRLLR